MRERIFNISGIDEFEKIALQIFKIQSRDCAPYAQYIAQLEIDPDDVTSIDSIPFLPVTLFKSREIICGERVYEKIFTSSATSGVIPASHYVKDLSLYRESFFKGFSLFHGEPGEYTILALLPSYLEREGSSLVYMASKLIEASGKKESGFYLYNYSELYQTLLNLKADGDKTILLGVTFALLDFIKSFQINFPTLTVIETGGMKGRGVEISREELHSLIKKGFGIERVGSEYGMAELLSQAWSAGEGVFKTPPWMQIQIRDLNNPFTRVDIGATGGINVIDLANLHSCSFIETQDLGIKEAENTFRVLGRIINSEIRGCNILLEN
ncbi:MAG: acyltransferase [Bacteroidales bacterium]|nr:acyltransferase [Bacteroidales bacterium]